MRMGLGVAAVVLVSLSACGESGLDDQLVTETELAPTTTAPEKIALADACPKIQDALSASFDPDDVIPKASEYGAFADAITELVERVDPKGVPLLTALRKASLEVALTTTGPELVEARSPWFDTMARVTDTCQQLGAPLA